MKIALVHEFLNQLGGAEKVLQNFLEIWSEADVHVILYNREKTAGQFENYKKKISWLNELPGTRKHPRLFLALMPAAIESFGFSEYDVVLSDSSSFAKGIKTDKLHICYVQTPTRFLWTEKKYLDQQNYPGALKFFGRLVLPWLRRWDYRAAQRPNYLIANSANVRDRIKKYYNRDSEVLFPPVDTDFFKPTGSKQDYFFTASRLEPYKKIDIIVEAFNELGWPLKVAGTGTQLEELKKMARTNIEFLGRVADRDLPKYYSEAKAFVFAAEEDAGIVFLESLACGTPVIAYRKGGALEVVKEGITGEFFESQTPESLVEKLKSFKVEKYDRKVLRENALQFDKKVFQKKIKEFVEEKYANRT